MCTDIDTYVHSSFCSPVLVDYPAGKSLISYLQAKGLGAGTLGTRGEAVAPDFRHLHGHCFPWLQPCGLFHSQPCVHYPALHLQHGGGAVHPNHTCSACSPLLWTRLVLPGLRPEVSPLSSFWPRAHCCSTGINRGS